MLGTVKTIYHLLVPISIPVETIKAIYTGIVHKDDAGTIVKSTIKRIYHNFQDIIRTPIYTIALTIIVITGVIIGPFIPGKLYELRALAGRLENALNRGEESWTLAPCFQPVDDIVTIEASDYSKNDTEYDQEAVLHGLNNLARSYVQHRRKQRNLFDNCYQLVKHNEVYISPACA